MNAALAPATTAGDPPHTGRRPVTLLTGTAVLGLIVLAALAAPVLTPHDPLAQNLGAGLQGPSAEHLLGTDQLGRDVLTRLLYAARTDLRVGALAVLTPFVVGTLLGSLSAFAGGWVDRAASWLVDVVMTFPFYVIALAIAAVSGAGERGIYLAFALVGWVAYARVVRAATQVALAQPWVAAARDSGLSAPRVLLRHILPNTLPQAVVFLFSDVVYVITAVVTLSYLGLGIQPPTPDWGTMIADGQAFLTTQWWIAGAPGLAVLLTGVGLSLVADGLQDRWGDR